MDKNLSFFFELAKADTILARRLSSHGMSFSEFTILYHLNQAPEQKLRRIDLAEHLGLSASGITRILLPMEKIGLIERDLSETDGRARYAKLTKAGKNFLDEAEQNINNKIEDLIQPEEGQQIAALTKLLTAISGR